MSDVSLESLLPKADNSIYTLSRMAALRALELAEGRKPLVNADLNQKLTTTSLHEIANGKIAVRPELLSKEKTEVKKEDE